MKKDNRKLFLEDGSPRYLRLYYSPGFGYPYTIVFSGRYAGRTPGYQTHASANANPTRPTHGFYQHGETFGSIDRPAYSHLGTKIKWADLPEELQKVVLSEYKEVWNIVDNPDS